MWIVKTFNTGPNTPPFMARTYSQNWFLWFCIVLVCSASQQLALVVVVDFCYSTASLFHVLYNILYYAHTCLRHIFHFEGFCCNTHSRVLPVNGLLANKKDLLDKSLVCIQTHKCLTKRSRNSPAFSDSLILFSLRTKFNVNKVCMENTKRIEIAIERTKMGILWQILFYPSVCILYTYTM